MKNNVAVPYEEGLKIALADPYETAAYLNAALEDDDPNVFLLALQDIAKANSMTFPMQQEKENKDEIAHLNTLLHHLGLRLSIEVTSPA